MPAALIVLAGRPGMGKSAVALATSMAAARSGRGAVFASLEMSTEQLGIRAISEASARLGPGYSLPRCPPRQARGARHHQPSERGKINHRTSNHHHRAGLPGPRHDPCRRAACGAPT